MIYVVGEDGLAHEGYFRGFTTIPTLKCTDRLGLREIKSYKELVLVWQARMCPVCFPVGFPDEHGNR